MPKEDNLEKIVQQTKDLIYRLTEMYRPFDYNKKIIVPKEDFIKFHDEIMKKGNAIALINLDIVLSCNINDRFDKDYYEILRKDLENLIDLIKDFIKPFTDSITRTIGEFDVRTLRIRSYSNKLFDNDALNDKYDFDLCLGALLRKNGLLDELYYSLPEELINEELTVSLYKRLSSDEVGIAYYTNFMYEGGNNKTFYGNSKTDQIFFELNNRKTEEIENYIKYLIKLPCNYVMGIIAGFINLRDSYHHDVLTSKIYNMGLSDGFSSLDDDELSSIYNCLVIAENIKPKIKEDKENGVRDISLDWYVRDYYITKNKY